MRQFTQVLFLVSAALVAPFPRDVIRFRSGPVQGARSQIKYTPKKSPFTGEPSSRTLQSLLSSSARSARKIDDNLEEKFNFEVTFGNDNRRVNTEAAIQEALRVPVLKDSRIAAPTDFSSPSADAALTFIKEIKNKDGLCGIPTEIFLENILKGRSREEAAAEATQAYLQAYNRGERLVAGSPCAKADLAWREAVVAGTDPVLESALAFMNAWPGVQEGNPCAVSGVEYVKAILAGSSHLEANRKSVASFASSIKDLATSGRSIKDKACLTSANRKSV